MQTMLDYDQRILLDWDLVRTIGESDPDLSARDEVALERSVRLLLKNKPLSSQLRETLSSVRARLAELVAND